MESLYDMPYPQYWGLSYCTGTHGQRPPSLASLFGPICGTPGALEEPQSDCFFCRSCQSILFLPSAEEAVRFKDRCWSDRRWQSERGNTSCLHVRAVPDTVLIRWSHPVYMHASLEPEWNLTYNITMAVKKPSQTLKKNRFLICLKKLETLTPFGGVS